jgi:hypothetical protein
LLLSTLIDLQVVEKGPFTALSSSLVIATYFYVRLIPRNFGRLVAGRSFDFVELKEGIHSDAVCRPIQEASKEAGRTFLSNL